MKLASRLQAIKPSPTLALNSRAKALAAKGVDVVVLAAGEPDFDTPEYVKQAAVDALRAGFTKYTATNGIPELREAICAKLEKDNGLRYTPDQVLVTSGGKQALYNFCQAALEEGDEVLIFAPYWVSYPDMVRLAGATPVIVPTREEDGFAPDPDAIRRALTPRTRAVIINSPGNPTGAVYSRAALERIAEVLRPHDCLIVTDDIYEKLLYTEERLGISDVAPDLVPRLVVVNGMSKAYSMTGWRLGYIAGPKPLVAAMQMVQDQSTSNASSIGQKAALAALQGPPDTLAAMVKEYRERRDFFVAGLNALDGVRCRMPEGAFYAFADVRGLLGRSYKGKPVTSAMQLSEILLDDFRVAAVPGEPFGAEGYVRMSFVTSREVLQKGLTRLGELVKALS
ncbi:pyridoxal phosphate-dependent aminotransferase [Corallococcus macrosporus]|uniref:Aminotransferase n=2 Tax=Myxococcaceae TaxID=31 RepID=A0A250JW74_9BACT|nr:pyridoxal phosphate-dependent aminotransferase [Corallococcus macrosporus]AEI66836.1 putative aspartate aminotransferase [Corallococcus macrosporus]ATB47722.1 aspartate aminotransferase [Corallococcus macrosporus DSM 14697]